MVIHCTLSIYLVYLLVLSADYFCKQFGPDQARQNCQTVWTRSGPTELSNSLDQIRPDRAVKQFGPDRAQQNCQTVWIQIRPDRTVKRFGPDQARQNCQTVWTRSGQTELSNSLD